MALRVAAGGCAFLRGGFGFYTAPAVACVRPERGPRYGSFPVTVTLEDSLERLVEGRVGDPWFMLQSPGCNLCSCSRCMCQYALVPHHLITSSNTPLHPRLAVQTMDGASAFTTQRF